MMEINHFLQKIKLTVVYVQLFPAFSAGSCVVNRQNLVGGQRSSAGIVGFTIIGKLVSLETYFKLSPMSDMLKLQLLN